MTDENQATDSRNAKPLYATVAVALPLRSAYTYKMPESGPNESESPAPRVGSIVRVPVRGKATEGVVTGLSGETSVPKNRLKSIQAVLTPDYAIGADLLALAEWMTEYYLAGPGETLAAISFFGLADRRALVEKRVRLADPVHWRSIVEGTSPERGDGASSPASAPRVTERQRDVVLCLLEELNEPMSRSDLCRRAGCSASVVAGLLKKGVLEELSRVRHRDDGYGPRPEKPVSSGGDKALTLTAEQQSVLDRVLPAVEEKRFEVFLLYGITGSGKTEVYLRAIARVLELGRQAIVLVPEISLTPQAVQRFRSRFGSRVGVYHSQLTGNQKYDLWRRIDAGEVHVLIGARSAVFAPFRDLGLVVVDEEHEHSYKQSDPAPRYHARDVAVWRSRYAGVPAILGSATPSLESVLNARPVHTPDRKDSKKAGGAGRGVGEKPDGPAKRSFSGRGKYTLLELTERVGEARLPDVHLIDMGAHVREDRETALLCVPLREAVAARLERGEQSILFLNRRGFSNFLLCMACKTTIRCAHCDVVMTWHKAIGRLMCHFCGDTRARPAECPECGAPNPAPIGAGTQRVEEEVRGFFPDARLLRIDADTTRGKHGFLRLWEQIERGDADILLGTQMIAKGLHLERVTLVGVISADHSLFLPDFRSAERTFALLTQVAGRSGRMRKKGEVFIQTFVAHHYAIQRAVDHDPEGFWRQELHMRETLRFPPLWRLLLVRLSGLKAERVAQRAVRLGKLLRDRLARDTSLRSLSVLGPTPCPISRIQDKTRWQIVIRGQNPALMRRLLFQALGVFEKDKNRAGVSLTLDMDPTDLL